MKANQPSSGLSNQGGAKAPPLLTTKEKTMEKALELFFAVTGTVLIILSLQALVPMGNWLYLGGLVLGYQTLTMALRSAFK